MKKLIHGVCCIGLVLIVGCGKDSSDKPFVYWRTLTGAPGLVQEELIQRYNAEHPDASFEVEFQGSYPDLAAKLVFAHAANAQPDLSQLGTFEIQEFARQGVLTDLRPFLESSETVEPDDWPGTLREAGAVDGGVYWVPFNVSVPILYCSQEAFEEVGLEPPATWNEFFTAAETITARDAGGNVTRSGVALWDNIWPLISMVWSEGGEFCSRDYSSVTLDAPAIVEVMSKLQALMKSGAATLPDAASGGHRAAFKTGQAAMILDSPAPFEEIIAQSSGFTPIVAAFPAGSAGRVYAPGGGGLVIPAGLPTERAAAAWNLVEFLLAPEQLADYARRAGYVAFTPAAQQKLAGLLNEPPYRVIYSNLLYVRGDFSVTMESAIRDALTTAYLRILIDGADVATALREADAAAEAKLASRDAGS